MIKRYGKDIFLFSRDKSKPETETIPTTETLPNITPLEINTLIQAHYDGDKKKFDDTVRAMAKKWFDVGNEQVGMYLLSMVGDVRTFIPM